MNTNKANGRSLRLKGLLCLGVATLALSAASAQAAGEGPIGGIFGSYPVSDKMDSQYLTGGWNGWRSKLADDGVTFEMDYGSESMGNTRGGLKTGVRYSQQVRAKANFDMTKIAGWTDSRFHIMFNDRRGDGATQELVGNRFYIQENFGQQYTKLVEASFDQKLLNGRLQYHIGYFPMGNDFGGIKLGGNFVNAAFCIHPLSMMGNSGWANYPSPRWAGNVTYWLAKDVYVKTGVSQVNSELNTARNSFNPFGGKTLGAIFPTEFGYTPGKGTAYPGTYHFGFYYDNSRAQVKGTSRYTHHRDGFYVQAEQKIFSPQNDAKGLSVFGEYMWSDPDTATLRNWLGAGLVYQGLIPGRPKDTIGLGYIQASVNKTLLANAEATAALTEGAFDNFTNAERLVEASYTYNITDWASLRPDVQYIINPGSFKFTNTRNALVVGTKLFIKI